MARESYHVQYSQEAVTDIKALRAFDQRKILDTIERHLFQNPTQLSRTRIKLMIQPFWSEFRLRVNDFRVYYDVDVTRRIVNILRVLKKDQVETREEPPNETH